MFPVSCGELLCVSLAPKHGLAGRTWGVSASSSSVSLAFLYQAQASVQEVLTFHPQLYPASFSQAAAPSRESGFQARSYKLGLWLAYFKRSNCCVPIYQTPECTSTDPYPCESSTSQVWELPSNKTLSSWWFQTAGFYIFQHYYKMAMKSMRRSEQRAESTLLLVQTRPIVQVVVANEVIKPLYLSPKTQGSPWFYLLKVECLCYLVVTLMFYVYMLPPHLREKISGMQEYWVSRI